MSTRIVTLQGQNGDLGVTDSIAKTPTPPLTSTDSRPVGLTQNSSELETSQAEDTTKESAERSDLKQSLTELRGQAQFLLYLTDQIEESLDQFHNDSEADAAHAAFLCKVVGMYSGQLESTYQGMGSRVAETCQEVYLTTSPFDLS